MFKIVFEVTNHEFMVIKIMGGQRGEQGLFEHLFNFYLIELKIDICGFTRSLNTKKVMDFPQDSRAIRNISQFSQVRKKNRI